MTQILFDAVEVNVALADRIASAPSLDIAVIFDPDLTGTITNLTESYVGLEALVVDFDLTTKVYKCAKAHYDQPGHNTTIKVARITAGDASITASLNAIWDQDQEYIEILTTTKNQTKLVEIADWVNTSNKPLIFGVSLEPTTAMLDSNDVTDFASVIAAKSYNNVYCNAHWNSGIDSTSCTIVITTNVATVTQIAHGVRLGDIITGSTSTEVLANGNHSVSEIVDDDNFKFLVTAGDLTSEAYIYNARYDFIESSLQGLQFGEVIGSTSWAFKTLTSQVAMPKTFLSSSQASKLVAKGYIVYTSPQNNISVTNDGNMIGGRSIAAETVRIWISLNMAVDIFNVQKQNEKIPYTNSGFQLVRQGITKSLDAQLSRSGLTPLDETQNYIVDIPGALTAPAADRAAGIMPTITVTARIGGEVRKIKVNVTLVV
jgi:hypothetical protein